MDLEQKAYCNITYTHPETKFGLARSDQLHAIRTKEGRPGKRNANFCYSTTTTEIINSV